MPVASREEARDEIYDLITTAWNADLASQDVPLFFEGTKGSDDAAEKIPPGEPWARLSLRHLTGTQASLAGADATRRWERAGIGTLQIFTPLGQGLRLSDQLGKIAQDSVQGKTTAGGIWFRNVSAPEIGRSGAWFQTNVEFEFLYDEVQ